jgi:predicted 3-demethylubiquinone-9 3-methyltransferase (glyoxalase superfamily)
MGLQRTRSRSRTAARCRALTNTDETISPIDRRSDTMRLTQPITPSLWFDKNGEEAANFYVAIFPNSKMGKISRYGEAGREFHGMQPGTAMSITFTLNGQPFTAINGGPVFKFTEAISFQLMCETQEEVDYFWDKLSAGGDPKSQRCGWLKDKFGVSWQVVPTVLGEMLSSSDGAKAARATNAMMKMSKLDIAALRKAFEG